MSQSPLWQDQARAAGGEELVAAIEALTASQANMAQAQKQMGDDIHEIKTAVAELANTAFPDGDTEGHRRYHELIIQKTEEVRRLRVAIQEKTISALIWSFIVFLATCVGSFILNIIKGTIHP